MSTAPPLFLVKTNAIPIYEDNEFPDLLNIPINWEIQTVKLNCNDEQNIFANTVKNLNALSPPWGGYYAVVTYGFKFHPDVHRDIQDSNVSLRSCVGREDVN